MAPYTITYVPIAVTPYCFHMDFNFSVIDDDDDEEGEEGDDEEEEGVEEDVVKFEECFVRLIKGCELRCLCRP